MKTLFLHIGLQKTGTSSLQARLMGADGPLARAGIDPLPGVAGPGPAHHNAAWEIAGHRRHDPALPGMAALVAAAHASSAERLFVSCEAFGNLPAPRIADLTQRLEGLRLRVVIVLRNPLDWAESLYAQAAKRSLPGSFADFTDRLADLGRLDPGAILARWEAVFGAGAITPLFHEDHPDIARPVAALLGLPPDRVPSEAARQNQSLNERFVAASQSILGDCAAGRLVLAGRPVPPEAQGRVAWALLGAGADDPAFHGRPVFLDRDAATAFLARFRSDHGPLAARGPLPARWHTPDPARRAPLQAGPAERARLLAALEAENSL